MVGMSLYVKMQNVVQCLYSYAFVAWADKRLGIESSQCHKLTIFIALFDRRPPFAEPPSIALCVVVLTQLLRLSLNWLCVRLTDIGPIMINQDLFDGKKCYLEIDGHLFTPAGMPSVSYTVLHIFCDLPLTVGCKLYLRYSFILRGEKKCRLVLVFYTVECICVVHNSIDVYFQHSLFLFILFLFISWNYLM